jgi:CDP-diacylglycerol--glycerol-3-phosphate 3-phosphatidyltransferase
MGPIQRNIPNALSTFRICAAFAFPAVPHEWRIPLIVLAALSEFLDGFLARRWKAETPLGQLLDPIADKLFVLSTIGVLIHEHQVTVLQFILLAARDIVVAIGAASVIWEVRRQAVPLLKPRWSGKIATTFQFGLLFILFTNWPLREPFLYVTILLSVISAIDYLYIVLHRRFDPIESDHRPVNRYS